MNSTVLDKPRAGLLVPVYALRRSHDLGIGDTTAVVEAIDFAAAHGFSVLQLLPVQETFGDHSPYNPISSRALSPALLTLLPNEVPGLTHAMLERAAPESWLLQLRSGNVRQQAVHALKTQILLDAYFQFSELTAPESQADFAEFRQVQTSWLDSYTLFRLLVREYEGNTEWAAWNCRSRNSCATRYMGHASHEPPHGSKKAAGIARPKTQRQNSKAGCRRMANPECRLLET
jgi:4-alpha-glucanotransferase